MRRPYIAWLLLAAYAALIFFQSSLPSPQVGPQFPGQDKLLHLVAYTLMSVLACRALASLRSMRSVWTICLAGMLLTVLFGLSDEWHQSFVPGRTADKWDLAADAAGALLGAAVYGWCRRSRKGRASFSLVDK